MRRIFSVLSVVFMFSLLFYAAADAVSSVKNVTVADVRGKAEVIGQGSGSAAPVIFGMKVGSGDTIKTQKDSYVDLSFDAAGQDAMVRVEANSNMKIADYIASNKLENKKIALELAMGDVLIKANQLKNESQFQVRTPTSVVGVRGTGFKVSVSAEK
ncbi:MAG: FecR domain-containing protein [Candidatus Omnitrophica bacterium]|nr:FecR domain-containing protein [Candidatus Omnitrophota bacterium]